MSNDAFNMDDFHTKNKHLITLYQFIKANKEEQFLEYISNLTPEEIDVNMRDENGNYLVFFAIIMNNRRILRVLIEYGCRLDVIDTEGYSILYYPIKYNYIEIIDILLENDKKIIGISLLNIKDRRGAVPLFYAIQYKNQYALQELLISGADANYKNDANVNSLHLAVRKRDITMVKMLTKYVKNLDARTNSGSTALHFACNYQSYDIVKILLEKGASQNVIEADYDFYPIFYAVVQNNVEITKLLVDYNANPNNQDYEGNTVIHYAILNNHTEILDYIINHYPVKYTNTNVYIEDINNKLDVTRDYIDPNIVNIDGLTITHLMLYNYRTDYDKYLTKILPHTNLNYQDNIGNTILHLLLEYDVWKKFVDILETKKLNIFIKNIKGISVMDMVHIQERELFLNTVIKSYYNYLKKYENGWAEGWQNTCSSPNVDEADCLQLIRKNIVNDNISAPIKKNKINISIVEDEVVHFSTFTGSVLDVLVGFKYLTKKYPDATSLFHSNQEYVPELEKYNQSLGIAENPHQHLIHFEIRWVYQRIFLPPGFESVISNIINSKKYKYIIIPIGIILSNGHHSNGLFYDIDNNIMERFEPHGSDYPNQFNYNPDLLDEILYKKISNILSKIRGNVTIKYYKPMNYLPKIGFQTLENTEVTVNKNIGDPNGFCTLWTIWYLDYRLQYPSEKPKKIVKNLIRQIKIINASFRSIIRNYSRKITDLRDSYLAKIKHNINDYINNRLSIEELRKLLIIILTDNSVM